MKDRAESSSVAALNQRKDKAVVWRIAVLAVLGLSLIIGGSLAWNIFNARQQVEKLAKDAARASFNKDQAFRLWGTRHGGIYVKANDRTPPNTFLEHIPDRDIRGSNGTLLTLMDPATMLRQVMDEFPGLYGIRGRITALTPLQPANLADSWEEKAIESFANGAKEAFEFTGEGPDRTLRLMRPMMTKKPCLKCHGHQGFKDGDLHGGVGVLVPMEPYMAGLRKAEGTFYLTHGIIWLIGLGAIGYGAAEGRRRIRERSGTQKKLEIMATHDMLTGLPNRTLFGDHLSMAQAQADRHDSMVAVFFLDLDFFKDINDSEGHVVGDILLQEVARRLHDEVRRTDTVARLGGDEFAIIQNNVSSVDDVMNLGEKLLKSLESPFEFADKKLHMGASVGVTLYPLDTTDPGDLVRNADLAMYAAKNKGRNTLEFYSVDMSRAVTRRRKVERELREALENGEFFLEYQPKVEAQTRRVVGAEALIRWRKQGGEIVPPGEFIPAAERTGIIGPLGQWTLEEACRQANTFIQEGLRPISFAVNLSAVQFRQADLFHGVERALSESGLDPQLLELEVTESVAMQDPEQASRVLDRLAGLGCTLALDDFGTGHSSLAYLKRFPLTRIKIDRSFVRDVLMDPNDAAIVGTIISMARSMNMEVTAEGVETKEQLLFLRDRGCHELQGFYFGKPAGPDELAQMIAEGQAEKRSSGH